MYCPSQLVIFCVLLDYLCVSRSIMISEYFVRDRASMILTKEPLTTLKVSSELDCYIKCVNYEDCGFALFNTNKKTCKLYTNGDGETIPEDGWISWRIGGPGKDCADILKNQPTAPDGVYIVRPMVGKGIVSVFCDMTDDGGGWTVLQRHKDGSIDFNKEWGPYKNGFGSLESNFWLGNNIIWRLTNQRTYEIKFDLESWNNGNRFASYTHFKVNNESDNFRLSLGIYSGNAGDSFGYHNNRMFTTKDRDNDEKANENCAQSRYGGWWYRQCHQVNLNGIYNSSVVNRGIQWFTFRNYYESLKYSAMKIRPHRDITAKDCADILNDKPTAPDGVYIVRPLVGEGLVSVFCDMTDNGGGWTVLQRRKDGSRDFNQGWELYKNGFGGLHDEFWLGNNIIWRLTNQRTYELKFDLESWNHGSRFASYTNFKANNESDNFRLSMVGIYSGDAGDSFGYHNNRMFTTKDRDNDEMANENCAQSRYGGWWYRQCHQVNLNGIYNSSVVNKGIQWFTFRNYYESLKYSAMKIRPN